jgi:hypothetical protein
MVSGKADVSYIAEPALVWSILRMTMASEWQFRANLNGSSAL